MVVVIAFGAHFTTTSIGYFKSRMEHIKAAVERLQKRGSSPSPVFVKSMNTRNDGRYTLEMPDFYSYEIDQVTRALFIGMPNVTIIDAWDMTLSHRTGYAIHPSDLVIKEEIKMFVNFLCR